MAKPAARIKPRLTPAQKQEILDSIGTAISDKRTEAVSFRKESGIEDVWLAAEEAYLGIDDANRHEFAGAKWAKPTSMEGPVTTPTNVKGDDVRSTVFVPLTARYVDAATSKLCEIALPIDDKAFSLDPTPVPELVGLKDDLTPLLDTNNQPMMKPVQDGQGNVVQSPVTVKDVVEEQIAKAGDCAKKAERRIYDWMVESNYPAEMRKVIHDAARIGVAVLKGPFPQRKKVQAISTVNGGVALEIVEKVFPAVEWKDPWNIFPAPGCGEDVHDGDYFFERDYLSKKKLKELGKSKGYLKAAIDKVLKEGPGKTFVEDGDSDKAKAREHRYEVWYYYGILTRDELEVIGTASGLPDGEDDVFAIVMVVNDTVIRASLNPLDSGRFPYHVMPWRRRAGNWAGVGVAEQVSMPQRMVNAGTRSMLDNGGLSAGVQIVMDRGAVVPADGRWSITRNKIWYKNPDSTADDVRKVFDVYEFPNRQSELMAIIQYGFKLAEEASSIPLVTQGQDGQTAPQTFGQAELQNNNAHTLLRNIGNTLDDRITDPLVRMYYEWLLLDPDVPNDEKGDFQINAHGSSAMVERSIQEWTLTNLMNVALNPAFGMDPKRLGRLVLKSKRLDPRDVEYSEEELAKMSSQPTAPAPVVQAAQIREQGATARAQLHEQGETQRTQIQAQASVEKTRADTDRDTVYVQAQATRDRNQAIYRMEELKLKREIAYLEWQIKRGVAVDANKVKLAETALKLRTQKELSMASLQADMTKHVTKLQSGQVMPAPVEVAGRAPDGQAFQR